MLGVAFGRHQKKKHLNLIYTQELQRKGHTYKHKQREEKKRKQILNLDNNKKNKEKM